VKNDNNSGNKKDKKINKIKEQLARLRAKLKADAEKQTEPTSKLKPKKSKQVKIEAQPKPKVKEVKRKQVKTGLVKKNVEKTKKQAKAEKKKQAKIKAAAKKKAKAEKKKQAKIKATAKKKAKEEAKRKAKEEAKRKVEEEAKRKAEEEAKIKAEEEAKRTYEEELEEQLTEEEITGFQLEKTDMDKMCNRVCEMIADYENNGILQSNLWKKLKLSSRDGSRLALKLERMGMITREKILEKERWTYRLIIKKIPISTKSIEGAPCLTCQVASKCSLDGEVSPKTCQWIEDWVLVELKNK